MFGVETIGSYDVRSLGNGKYSVAVNNGNLGAYVTDKAGVDALREKYNRGADTVEISGKDKQSKSKDDKSGDWGKAIASTFIPGLGQFCDGRVSDGFKQIGAVVGLTAVSKLASLKFLDAFAKAAETAGKVSLGGKAAYAAAVVAGLGAFAAHVYNIVDAYKGGKSN